MSGSALLYNYELGSTNAESNGALRARNDNVTDRLSFANDSYGRSCVLCMKLLNTALRFYRFSVIDVNLYIILHLNCNFSNYSLFESEPTDSLVLDVYELAEVNILRI